jgi:hypothetical protein
MFFHFPHRRLSSKSPYDRHGANAPKRRIRDRNTIIDIRNRNYTEFPVSIEGSGLIAILPAMVESISRSNKLQQLYFYGNQPSEWPTAFGHWKKAKPPRHEPPIADLRVPLSALDQLDAGQNRLTTFPIVPSNCGAVALDFNLITELTASSDGFSGFLCRQSRSHRSNVPLFQGLKAAERRCRSSPISRRLLRSCGAFIAATTS